MKLTDRLERLEKDTGDKQNLFDTIEFKLKEFQDTEGSEAPVHISEIKDE